MTQARISCLLAAQAARGRFLQTIRRQIIAHGAPVRPFLIAKDDDGQFRLTVRETRYNSQGYPLVTATLQTETFKTANAARTHARENFGAETGQFAAK